MSYIKNRIAQNREEDAAYRAAYDEEVELLDRQQKRRECVMKQFAEARKSRHMSQQDVAKVLNLSQARVSQIERGVETVSVDRFFDLARAIGLHVVVLQDKEVQELGLEKLVLHADSAASRKPTSQPRRRETTA